MFYVYAKRTDTDCFIVIEDEQGEKRYARTAFLYPRATGVLMASSPVTKEDGVEFRSAGVYVMCESVSIVLPCDENGKELRHADETGHEWQGER